MTELRQWESNSKTLLCELNINWNIQPEYFVHLVQEKIKSNTEIESVTYFKVWKNKLDPSITDKVTFGVKFETLINDNKTLKELYQDSDILEPGHKWKRITKQKGDTEFFSFKEI